MTKLELAFRRHLLAVMRPFWVADINRENPLNPGIPDLTFAMTGMPYQYQPGFLELKSVVECKKIKIEPSQHRWMEKWSNQVKVWFLIEVADEWFLVKGRYHQALLTPRMEVLRELCDISTNRPTVLAERLRETTKI